jgi:serine/threonine-protein phosphatase 2A regulatory subunit B
MVCLFSSCHCIPSAHFFVLFLDKTIKLWKSIRESLESLRVVSESNHHEGGRTLPPPSLPSHLPLPRMMQQDNIIASVPRKVYLNAHAYHIHSILVNSDQEAYISVDDPGINLWNLNISDQSFSTFSFP